MESSKRCLQLWNWNQYTKEEILSYMPTRSILETGTMVFIRLLWLILEKEPSELTDYECAVLAGIPNAPSVYSQDES